MSDDFYYRPPGPKRPPRPRPLSEQARRRLEAVASPMPQKGEVITIRWPGGPHDFEMIFDSEMTPAPPWPGWHFLRGVITSPERWHPNPWSPMAHLVDGEWTMLPMGGRIADVRDPALVEGDYEGHLADG